MERRHDGHTEWLSACDSKRDFVHDATEARDAEFTLEKEFGRGTAERHDGFRAKNRKLREEIRTTAFDFMRERSAIVRRSRLQHVGDVDVLARKSHRADHLIQFLPCFPNKRPTGEILRFARCLTDEDEFCLGVSLAEHEVGVARYDRAVRTRCRVRQSE